MRTVFSSRSKRKYWHTSAGRYIQLIKNAPGEEAKKYIRTAYRKTSVIGDGGQLQFEGSRKQQG